MIQIWNSAGGVSGWYRLESQWSKSISVGPTFVGNVVSVSFLLSY
jgi:hypothetical protein